MKEQDKKPLTQTKEKEIGNVPEKEFRMIEFWIVKMTQNLENKMEIQINRLETWIDNMHEMINKDLEEIKNSQSVMNSGITEIKNTLKRTNSRETEVEERISESEDRMMEIKQIRIKKGEEK